MALLIWSGSADSLPFGITDLFYLSLVFISSIMSFIILLLGIVLLVLLITWAKLNPFLAFILVSILIGLAYGKNIVTITSAIQKGMGDLLGSILIILGLGAMLGKIIADSGAAQKIAGGLMDVFGRKYIMWALLLTGFVVGIPLFYGTGFVLVVPLIITLSYRYNISAVYIGLPMLAALSVTHGFLPPHPSPTALVKQFNADIGLTLLYGMIVAIPVILIAGPLFSLTLKKYTSKPLETFKGRDIPAAELPSMFNSLFTALLPVILIAFHTIVTLTVHTENSFTAFAQAIGDPIVAMTITLLYACYSLGLNKGKNIREVMQPMAEAVKDISMIIFILAGAGGLKQVLMECGISTQIADVLHTMNVHPLIAAWSIAAIIRVALGSSTVAGLTAAGIVAPMIVSSGANPNLMVLATGAGSLLFSHVNDTGFWMFKEYFNLSLNDTFKTWSLMETVVSVTGLVAVLILSNFV
ncbi:MAG: gluconate transporter [Ferruginibacter sp.]|nr:gluconate transporter [Ferruginibacter sp.]